MTQNILDKGKIDYKENSLNQSGSFSCFVKIPILQSVIVIIKFTQSPKHPTTNM